MKRFKIIEGKDDELKSFEESVREHLNQNWVVINVSAVEATGSYKFFAFLQK